LAEIAVSLNSNWTASAVTIDDSRRPFVVPTGLLQEMALTEAGTGVAESSYRAVAAGFFRLDGSAMGPSFNLTASPASPPNGEFLLSFTGYANPATTPGHTYIVKGTVQDSVAPGNRATFEFVDFEGGGIRVRVLDTTNKALSPSLGFMVEISQIGGAS